MFWSEAWSATGREARLTQASVDGEIFLDKLESLRVLPSRKKRDKATSAGKKELKANSLNDKGLGSKKLKYAQIQRVGP